ncbi:MFS transporter [Serratia ureilytica]|uniref:Major facilitator superfamily protein n=3 Tax=environmental samples TaxID=48479 RepID=X2LBY9_9BACT|nr:MULTISPECIES: MFS transporter [Serratia]AHN97758.1 major facilitator superfamily protein [uncultured bacterium lac71]AHN98004.1 major facilitator superfamily protein [uncultured bacterium lac172]AWC80356.1 MFS transporter [Serratia marcescens]MBH1900370.1 MFS transporter [Serratia ureilytica]MBH2685980.1 MFS transporter [Serratia ureilytica]
MMLPWLTGEAAENQRRQIATRAIFFLAGLGMAAWAPLIPFVKARLGIDDGALGLLLFCLAAGSMAIMPFAGYLIAKLGCRAVLLGAGALLCIDLPLLALLDAPLLMGAALGVFGAVNGIMDVAMNSQAIIVERESGQAKMSGFHGFYSLGGIAGAGGVSLLLLAGLAPTQAIGLIALLIAILLLIVAGDLLAHGGIGERRRGGARWALAHGKILFIALLCFFVFLTEGAMLDWSALFLHAERGVAKSQAGIGFTLYAVAVACGRLYGDRLIGAVGRYRTLLLGSLCAAAGVLLTVTVPLASAAFGGLMLAGLGIANIVPILFNAVGNQKQVPPGQAFPAVTLVGYLGLLTGPALIGFIANYTSLALAFGCTLLCLLLVSISAKAVTNTSH